MQPAPALGRIRRPHRRCACGLSTSLRSKHPAVCLDETSKRLIGDVRAPLPPAPSQTARYDGEYVRNGTANIFMAFEALVGWRQVRVTDHRCRTDWAAFVKNLADGRYKDATRIVLVMDQLNTHTPASFYEASPPEEARRLAGKLESTTRSSTAPLRDLLAASPAEIGSMSC
jgi:hypothetical protein